MKLVIAVLTLTAFTAVAQTSSKSQKRSPAPATATETGQMLPLPIVKLTIEGNTHFPSPALLQATGLRIGQTATTKLFEAARQSLADLGLFDFVSYESHPIRNPKLGYSATFTVREVAPLYRVTFAGFEEKSEDLESYLKGRDPLYNGMAPPTQQILDRWARDLDAFTASRNHPKKVVGKLIPDGSNGFIIQFQPDEPLPAVARVEFTGNDAIDSISLQNSIGSVAYGLPFSEPGFRDFLEHQVKPLYEAKGMLKVRFEDITHQPVPPPTKGLLVNVKVVEGPVYKLRKVFVTGVDVDDRGRLTRLAALKGNEPANFDAINEAAARVNHSEQKRGYLHCKTTVERKLDDKALLLDVTFNVVHGAQYTFRTLTIKGLDLNGEAAVRKQWGEKPGDPFNPDYPNYFLSAIKDEGLFDHLGETTSAAKVDDEGLAADVTLNFAPEVRKPGERRKREGLPTQ